jgi:spore coat protein CotH
MSACTVPTEVPEITAPSDDSGETDTTPEPVEDSDPPEVPAVDPSDFVFDVGVIHRIDLTLDASAWSDIRDNPWAETWWSGDFALDGEVVGQVGVRAYGGASHVAGKPSFKVAFDRIVDGQEHRDLEQLKLDASTQDPGFLNEAVATGVLRDLGLPAARTGWAVVYTNGVRVGFYVLVEPIDDKFIQRWFGEDEGVLYGTTDGRYAQGLNRFTTTRPVDWYKVAFGEGDGSDIEAAADAIALGTRQEVEAVLDTETTMRISATRVMMGATDSFVSDGNNFYLYNHQGRIVVLPWDHDVELGGYAPVFWNMVVMDMQRPWEYSHWRPNSLTGEPYTEPLYARVCSPRGGTSPAGWRRRPPALWTGRRSMRGSSVTPP